MKVLLDKRRKIRKEHLEKFLWLIRDTKTGTSLVAQWLRRPAPNAGGPGLNPGQRTGSLMPQLKTSHTATMIKDLECCN